VITTSPSFQSLAVGGYQTCLERVTSAAQSAGLGGLLTYPDVPCAVGLPCPDPLDRCGYLGLPRLERHTWKQAAQRAGLVGLKCLPRCAVDPLDRCGRLGLPCPERHIWKPATPGAGLVGLKCLPRCDVAHELQ
jgi:hypothetical protein